MQQISTLSINGGSRQGAHAVVIYGHSISGQEVTTTSLGDVSVVEAVGGQHYGALKGCELLDLYWQVDSLPLSHLGSPL